MCSNCRDYEGPYDDNERDQREAKALLERMRKDTLKVLKEELEQVRLAYERAKKASGAQ